MSSTALIFLLIFLFSTQPGPFIKAGPTSCRTPVCLRESARLAQQISTGTDPCEDFYQFACGKYLKANKPDETFNEKALVEQAEKDILGLYNEPIHPSDHDYVKSAKKLFKACTNTQAIEEDGLKTVKEVFKTVGGGWPLVEGLNWDESKFDWVEATAKLRELGYPAGVFFDVQVKGDPRDKTQPLLEIRIPFKLDEALDVLSDQDEAIKNVLKAFGANVNEINEELQNLYQFSEEMKRQISDYRGLTAYPTYKVSIIQTYLKSINWVNFLNKITRPTATVLPDNYVIFVEENSIRERLDIISRTPKRVLANYMFWKVLEHMAPYLNNQTRTSLLPYEPEESRNDFCLRTTQENFTPNPISVLYAKKVLPQAKRNSIRAMVLNIRNEFLKGLEGVEWLSRKDKTNIEEKAGTLNIIVGEPESYFNDKIFDQFSIDMLQVPVEKENFLNLLAQVNRNRWSYSYANINNARVETNFDSWCSLEKWHKMVYSASDNLLLIPTNQVQDQAFDLDKPYYLTYGTFGKKVAKEISALLKLSSSYYDKYGNDIDGWDRWTVTKFRNGSDCIIRTIDRYMDFTFDAQLFELQANIIGTKLAYESYKTWTQVHGQELKLSNLNYTPKQLFWISTVQCKREEQTSKPMSILGETLRNFTRVATYASVRNNPDFGRDFSCKDETAMNPPYRCQLI